MQVLGDGNMQIECDIKLQMEKAEKIVQVGKVKVTRDSVVARRYFSEYFSVLL